MAPRRTNAELSETTRRELLLRAREIFAERGFAEAPIEEVVAASGLTKGALYHHFGSKLGLFEEVVRQLDAEILEALSAKVKLPLTPERFVGVCVEWVRLATRPQARRILLIDGPAAMRQSAAFELWELTSIAPLREALEALIASGHAKKLDTEAVAHLINGALNDAALWAGESGKSQVVLPRIERSMRALLSGLWRSRP